MFKNFLPNKILSLPNKVVTNLLILFLLLLIIGLTYSLILSPPDYIQGDTVRIMYIHVPSSFLALSCFGIIGITSIFNLVFKIIKKFSSYWMYIFINFNCNWFILGKTNLGSMVGLGRQTNIYVYITTFLFCLYLYLEIRK